MIELNQQTNMFQLTINNPATHGMTYEKIKNIMSMSICPKFYCMCTEVGNNGTEHIHVFVLLGRMIYFRTIKKHFPTAHIEADLRGSVQDNIDYVKKAGRWRHTEKGTTQVEGSYFEQGEYHHQTIYKGKPNYTKYAQHNNEESLTEFLKNFNTVILFRDSITEDNATGNIISKKDLIKLLSQES